MKVNAQIRDEWMVVPSKDDSNTVEWLGNQALSRYRQMHGFVPEDDVARIIKVSVGCRLSPSDLLVDVLDDDAFVKVGECGIVITHYNDVDVLGFMTQNQQETILLIKGSMTH